MSIIRHMQPLGEPRKTRTTTMNALPRWARQGRLTPAQRRALSRDYAAEREAKASITKALTGISGSLYFEQREAEEAITRGATAIFLAEANPDFDATPYQPPGWRGQKAAQLAQQWSKGVW
jgi:hypothetical protein